jgi:hypothetical protein
MPKFKTELAAIWPPTSDVERGADHRPQNPLRAIRAKPGTRAGNFVARRYHVHPAFARFGCGPPRSRKGGST